MCGRAALCFKLGSEGAVLSGGLIGVPGGGGGFSGAENDLLRSNDGLLASDSGSSCSARMIADISDEVVIIEMYESRNRRVVEPF